MKGRLWGWASLFMGAQLGNLKWAHLPGTLRYGWKGLWMCSVSLCGSSVKGTWREGSLAGDPEGYVEKALETGISFRSGPVWGNWRRARLRGTLREGWRGLWGWDFSLWRGSVEGALGGELLHWGPWKIRSDSLQIRASLSVGAPTELRGAWCLGGEAHILRTLKDGWRRAPLLGNPKIC